MNINLSKCELAGIGVKRSVLTALSGVNNVSLLTNCIRVLGVNFTYNSKLFHEKNYMACIKKLQKVLHVWGMRFLTLYGKIIIFKSLAFSKIIYLASMVILCLLLSSSFLKIFRKILSGIKSAPTSSIHLLLVTNHVGV